jgi:hypothetical protein
VKNLWEYIADAGLVNCEWCLEPLDRDDTECAFCGEAVAPA